LFAAILVFVSTRTNHIFQVIKTVILNAVMLTKAKLEVRAQDLPQRKLISTNNILKVNKECHPERSEGSSSARANQPPAPASPKTGYNKPSPQKGYDI